MPDQALKIGSPAERDEDRKVLGRALLASLAIHLLVLAGLQAFIRAEPDLVMAAGLRAELRRVPAATSTATGREARRLAMPETIPLQASENRRSLSRSEPAPSTAGGSRIDPIDSNAPSNLVPHGPVASAPTATMEVLPAIQAPGAVTRVAPDRLQAVDAEDVRLYRLNLSSKARQFKRYPVLARERGWQGTSEVAVDLSPNGGVSRVAIERTSGIQVLDEQALDMITRASRIATVPDGLRHRGARIVVPVLFSLDD